MNRGWPTLTPRPAIRVQSPDFKSELFWGLDCKNSQFYRLQQPHSLTLRPKEPMTSKVKENEEFAEWFRDWIAVIQQSLTSIERTLPEKTAGANVQEHSDGTHLLGSELRAASDRSPA